MNILKACLIAALLISLAPFARADEPNPEFNFVPWPKSVKVTAPGELTLTPYSHIVATDKSLVPLTSVLAGDIQMMTGQELNTTSGAGKAGDIVLGIDPELKKDGAYTVTVTDRITINGSGYVGTAHGASLLLQAITQKNGHLSVPHIQVDDEPYATFYGNMIDLARQDNSFEDLRALINMMHLYRLRFLQMHMSDDQSWTFPSVAFPMLGKSNRSTRGGPVPKVHSVAEWKELVRYADERGVTFVPEIETFGHSDTARRDDPAVFGPDVAVMNVTNPRFYPAMDTIMGELADVFKSSPYIHIGCDESNVEPISRDSNSKAFRVAHGLKDGTDLFAWHIAQMDAIVKKYGKKTIVWQDAPITDRVPKDVAIMVWHIDGNNGATMDYLNQGRPVIQVTWTPSVYNTVKEGYDWNAWTREMDPKLMLGSEMVLWELSGASDVPFLRYKSPTRNERVWNPFTNLPYSDFARRLEATDGMLDRLLSGIEVKETGLVQNLHNWLALGGPGDEGSGILPKFAYDNQSTVALTCTLPEGVIHYTLNGSRPTMASPVYQFPIKPSAVKAQKITLNAQVFVGGRPAAFMWSRDYYFKPVAGHVDGLLPMPGNRFSDPLTVTLETAMEGTVRYSLDGKPPTADSTEYKGPFKTEKKNTSIQAGLFVDGELQGEPWKDSFNWVDFQQNLTTGKPVTVSSQEADYKAEYAVDGTVDRDKAWWAGPYPQWLTVDLQNVYKLDRAQVFPYWDGHRYYQYKVEVSTDNKTWQQVVDMSANTKPATPQGDMLNFPAVDARYVRITILKNSANTGVHLVEFRVFEAGK